MELPDVDIRINSNGITIFCPNLNTPRFIPFDLKGRCTIFKSDNVEVDYLLQPEGITIFCSRIKQEKFVEFDIKPFDFQGDRQFLRIRTRSKVYNVPFRRDDFSREQFDGSYNKGNGSEPNGERRQEIQSVGRTPNQVHRVSGEEEHIMPTEPVDSVPGISDTETERDSTKPESRDNDVKSDERIDEPDPQVDFSNPPNPELDKSFPSTS
jgi:hypothetical protein